VYAKHCSLVVVVISVASVFVECHTSCCTVLFAVVILRLKLIDSNNISSPRIRINSDFILKMRRRYY
jgi:hypothetical protein